MSYPNAYCVKCGTHTDTQQKHTVLLQSQARALKGVCPDCQSDVYKILPKDKAFLTKVPLTAQERRRFPDAFCVKCQEHTPTVNPHAVVLENHSRAVTGSCGKCGSEVYRILGGKDETAAASPGAAMASELAPAKAMPPRTVPRSPLGESLKRTRQARPVAAAAAPRRRQARLAAGSSLRTGRWALPAIGVVMAIAAAVVAYSLVSLR